MPTSPVVHFLTLGCPKNEADTRRMCESVTRGGYSLTDDPEHADIAVVKVDNRVIGDGKPGPVTQDLLKRFRDYAKR